MSLLPSTQVPIYLVPSDHHRYSRSEYQPTKRGPFASESDDDSSRPPTPRGVGLPTNFAEVVKGIYRSSFPLPIHLNSISQLNLKTIITLVDKERSSEYVEFIRDNRITSHVVPIVANKTATVFTPLSTIVEVLRIIIDPANHPVLIHCNKGRHRTGCVIACFRRIQGWSLGMALMEYMRLSAPKARYLDQQYIRAFDQSVLSDLVDKFGVRSWVPNILPMEVGSESESTTNVDSDS